MLMTEACGEERACPGKIFLPFPTSFATTRTGRRTPPLLLNSVLRCRSREFVRLTPRRSRAFGLRKDLVWACPKEFKIDLENLRIRAGLRALANSGGRKIQPSSITHDEAGNQTENVRKD